MLLVHLREGRDGTFSSEELFARLRTLKFIQIGNVTVAIPDNLLIFAFMFSGGCGSWLTVVIYGARVTSNSVGQVSIARILFQETTTYDYQVL